jgi:gamma-glutamylcyclotransferase (GGCT)/AIG2-like uncharacterized protein YtfP
MTALFTYGSLMSPDILEMVIHRAAVGVPATLLDYRRAKIAGVSYPGMIPEPGSRVDGCLYKQLSLSDLEKLDIFEGEMYQRKLVEIHLEQTLQSYTYILAGAHAHLLTNEAWSYEDFLKNDKGNFIRNYGGWT